MIKCLIISKEEKFIPCEKSSIQEFDSKDSMELFKEKNESLRVYELCPIFDRYKCNKIWKENKAICIRGNIKGMLCPLLVHKEKVITDKMNLLYKDGRLKL